MAQLNLLDLAQRSGNDQVIGLVDDVLFNSPEIQHLPVLPKKGTTYRIGRRTAFPTASFSKPGAGVAPSKSQFETQVASLHFLDVQLRVPEAIVKADDGSVGDLLSTEARGAVNAAFITLGTQMYYGQSADPNGFLGLQNVINGDSNFEISAGGTGGSSSSAYLVRLANDGVSLAVGNDGALDMGIWNKIQVNASGTNSSPLVQMAYCNNFSGFFGLTVASQYSVWRVKLIDATHPLTDALAAQLMALVPIQYRHGLRWFMTRQAAYLLQKSRTAINYQPAIDGSGNPAFAPAPTTLEGVPITITDSLKNGTE